MLCGACQQPVDVKGRFPGARVTCACGASVTVAVPKAALPPSYSAAPRTARSLQCPRCKATMGMPWSEDTPHECPSCHGIFVPHAVMEYVLAESAERGPSDATGGGDEPVVYLPCPTCTERMNRTLYGPRSGLIVDICAKHGTWFDAGELARAAKLPRPEARSSASPSPPDADTIRARAELEVIAARESFQQASYEARELGRIEGETDTMVDLLWRAILR